MIPSLEADFPQEVVTGCIPVDIAPGFLRISAFILEKFSTKSPSTAEEIGFLTHY